MSQTTNAPSATPSKPTDKVQTIGSFCWWEAMTRNVAASKDFYSKAFGWSFQTCDGSDACGGYMGLSNKGRSFGGMMAMPAHVPAEVPSHWGIYVNVADVDASLVKAKTLGGTVIVEGTDIPQTGRFGVVADPTGATLCLFTGLPGVGCQGYNADNGSFCWSELLTSDPTAASKFYSALLGWNASTNLFGSQEYTTFSLAGRDPHDSSACAGGMMKIKAEWGPHPSCWLSYIWVEDLETAVSTVAANGGKVSCPPSDIPGVGRFAIISDPAGATVGLFTAPAKKADGCCGSSCGCGG